MRPNKGRLPRRPFPKKTIAENLQFVPSQITHYEMTIGVGKTGDLVWNENAKVLDPRQVRAVVRHLQKFLDWVDTERVEGKTIAQVTRERS